MNIINLYIFFNYKSSLYINHGYIFARKFIYSTNTFRSSAICPN